MSEEVGPRIVVISTALHAEAFAAKCIRSVDEQDYEKVSHLYIANDHETLKAACEDDSIRGRCLVRYSPSAPPQGENIYEAIHELKDKVIVALLDGDDWLARPDALSIVAKAYEHPDVWVTFGSFAYADGRPGFASAYYPETIRERSFAQDKWRATHLKTFRAGLYKQIPKSHLQIDGEWHPHGGDLAIMFSLLEMAGWRHRFIQEVIYTFNVGHAFESRKEDAEGYAALKSASDHFRHVRQKLPLAEDWRVESLYP